MSFRQKVITWWIDSLRFAIVVAILIAFHASGNLLLAWSRQCGMWMISILSPTPGGGGVAE